MNEHQDKFVSRVAAITVMVAGISAIAGWVINNKFLKSAIAGTSPMKFNVALAFVLSSAVLLIQDRVARSLTWRRISMILSVAVSLLGLITFLEYFNGINTGFDEFFTKDPEFGSNAVPHYAGRMSLVSAVNFMLIGVGLLFLHKERTLMYQFFYLASIALVSLLLIIGFSFITRIPTFVHLSIYDALGFILLTASIYFAQPMFRRGISFQVKLSTAFAAVIILIATLSIFSSYYSDRRISTSQWVEHTNAVLLESGQISALSKDIESESRGFVITGDSAYLGYFTAARNSLLNHVAKIKLLTTDNLTQQIKIDSVHRLVDQQIWLSNSIIQNKQEQGLQSAENLMSSRKGPDNIVAIGNLIGRIQQEENNLLQVREKERAKSIESFNRAFFVLIGSIFILIAIILFSIRHNYAVRKKAEDKIRESEQVFSTLFYKSPVLKAISDMDSGKYISVNDAFADFIKLNKEDIIGKTAFEINLLAVPSERARVVSGVKEKGFVRDLEMVLNSGSVPKWVSTNVDIVNLNGKDCLLSASIDITYRKTVEDNLLTLSHELEEKVLQRTEDLDRSEKQYRLLFENNPMPMWIMDLDTFKLLDVNHMATLQYGYSRKEFLSMTSLDMRPDADKELFKSSDHFVKISSANYNKGIWNHRKKDGTIIQVEIVAHDIIFEGVPSQIIVSNDVTKRKLAEEKLDKSEKLFRALIEKEADMKTLSTPDGKIFYASPSIRTILGYDTEEFLNIPSHRIIHPDDAGELIKEIEALAQKPGESFYSQLRLQHKNKSWIWCEGVLTNMLHEPAVAALVANFRDITARKLAEDSILLAEANYREIFDKANDAIYIHEVETGKVIDVNQIAAKMTGYTKEELLNGDPGKSLTGDPRFTMEHALQYLQRAAGGEPQIFEWQSKNKDGSLNWLEVNLKKATIAGEDRILAFFREINDRKKAELEIQQLNEELEQKVILRTEQLEKANQELEAFSYSVSHDLRAPLRAINGFATMVQDSYGKVLDAEGHRLFARITENAKKMGALIDDLLEFSRLGRKEIHRSPIRMTELAEGALAEINASIDHRANIKIHKLHPANADSKMIRQVMINLMSNAVKYSSKIEKPSIEVSSCVEENEIIYSVTDNGIGFNNQYVHKLFGVFQRLHLKADFEGTGVGLALVKRIINKHEGRVWATGEINKGATFYFSLPAINN